MAQGAAQAIEDAAVLGVVLAKVCEGGRAEAERLNKALGVYEKVRKDRAETLVELAAQSGRALHLGEGEAKKERDRLFREGKAVPDKWADADVQRRIYGHDCVAVAEEEFVGIFKSL